MKDAKNHIGPGLLWYLSRVKLGSLTGFGHPTVIRPVACNLKLTENCQSRCITCHYWKNKYVDDITEDRAVALINEELPEVGVRYLRLTGGEILLRKDLFSILSRMKPGLYDRVILKTNGLLLSRYASEINDSPVTEVSVSIDGLPETNDWIRGVKGNFDRAFSGLDKIKGKHIEITSNINKNTHLELDEFMSILKGRGYSWGFNLLDDNLYFVKDVDLEDVCVLSEQEINALIEKLEKYRVHSRKESEFIRAHLRRKTTNREFGCFLGYMLVDIVANGDVLSGCYVLKPLGNILDKRLKEVIDSPEYVDRARKMLSKQCPGCTCGFRFNIRMENALETLILKMRGLSDV